MAASCTQREDHYYILLLEHSEAAHTLDSNNRHINWAPNKLWILLRLSCTNYFPLCCNTCLTASCDHVSPRLCEDSSSSLCLAVWHAHMLNLFIYRFVAFFSSDNWNVFIWKMVVVFIHFHIAQLVKNCSRLNFIWRFIFRRQTLYLPSSNVEEVLWSYVWVKVP